VAPAVRTPPKGTTRALSAVLAAWGTAMLARPEQVARLAAPHGSRPDAWIVRLLGGRQLLQHALILYRPTRGVVLAGAAVDTLHALSMLGAAALWRQYRRPALLSAATAGGSAAAAAVLAAPAGAR
jgi:hypothetical protein